MPEWQETTRSLAVPVLAVLPPRAFDLLFGIRPGDPAWFALSLPFRLADAVYIVPPLRPRRGRGAVVSCRDRRRPEDAG